MGWIEDLKKSIIDSVKDDVTKMTWSELENPTKEAKTEDKAELIQSKAILTDPYYDQTSSGFFLTKGKTNRIANKTLRDITIRDWLVNTILQIRGDTVLRFSRPQEKKYDMGFRFIKTDNSELSDEDNINIKQLQDFISNCGRLDGTPKGEEMIFGDFVKLVTADALTFGHVAIEKVLTRGGTLHRFRPLTAETVYRVNPTVNRDVMSEQVKTANTQYKRKRSDNDPTGDGQLNEPPIEYYKYVQMSVDGRTLAAFGDEDLVFRLFNPKNFPDSNGYSISMVEQAVIMITNHLNVEAYNSNYFTHGYAARGILHLKGTVTQNSLASFRRQFYNTISGSNNAWRTPIVSGLDEVQWIPMSGSAREMEYINFNSHIMRSICSQFQIDPIEVGLDYLTSANGRGAAQAKESGQFKITYSRERGLIPILMFIEDVINNDIVPVLNPVFAQKYRFKFFGYTDETAQTDLALRQGQMTTFASMNDLLRWEEKKEIDHPVAKLPLNQSFWAMVEKNMTRGEIRETFFGDVGASQRPELQYIPGDSMFASWQQMLLTISNMKKQEAMQQQQMEQQNQLQQQQEAREQEKHDHEVATTRSEHARLAVAAGQPPRSLQDIAKEAGATGSTNIGGKVIANPINVYAKDDKE
jgi:hypothetical protein